MNTRRFLIAPAVVGALFIAGCSDDDSTDDTSTDDTEASSSSAATDADTTADDQAGGQGPGGGGAGGGEVDPTAIASEDELVEMIGGDAACGDGALDLHRGHQPIQSTLEDLLGISHDEMHVYMEEQDMNLAAVADEVELGSDNLTSSLIDYFTPAIDGLVEAGTITDEQADEYRTELDEAVTFRVNWDGAEAPLDFCTAST